MKNKFKLFYIGIYILNALLISFLYEKLPDSIPIHFNTSFQPDNYGPKFSLLILGIILPLMFYLMMFGLKKIDPLKENYERFEKTYNYIIGILILFFSIFSSIVALYANKNISDIREIFSVTFGLLFILMGNYIPQLKRNFFIGIKTPWTLSDEDVWNKTHRVGGRVFMIFGFLFILDGLLIKTIYPMYLLIGGIIFIFVYSYMIFPKDKKILSKKELEKRPK